MGIRIEFKNTGTYTMYGYQKYLVVREWNGEYYDHKLRVGRDTLIARVIEKYIIRKKFLNTGKRVLKKSLTAKQYRLLMGMIEAGSKYWQLYSKALKEKWTMKKLESQIFWRVV